MPGGRGDASSSRRDAKIVAAPQPGPGPAGRGRPDAAHRGRVTAPPTSRRPRTTRSSWPQQSDAALEGAPLRVGRPRRADPQAVRRGHRADLRRARRGRPARHHDPRPATSRPSPRSGSSSPPASRTRQERRAERAAEGARLRRVPGLGPQPRGQGRPQRRARRPRLPDRRAHRLRRLGRLLLGGRQRPSSSPSTTSSARATASRARRSSRSTTRSASTTRRSRPGTMLMDSAHRLRRRLHADQRRQPGARPGPRPQRPAVLAEHPVGQGDGPQRAGPRLRPGQGLRHDLPARDDRRRAGPGPRRRRDPAGRPRHGLRHARQRGPADRPHDDPRGQGPRTARTSSTRTCRRRASRSSARRRRSSSPTSCARTRSARSTRSGAGSRSATRTATTARRRSRPAPTTTPRTSTPTATSRRRPRRAARTAPTRSPSASGTATATTRRSRRRTSRSSRSTSRRTSGTASCSEASADWPITRFERPERPGPRSPSTRSRASCRAPAASASRSGSSPGTEPTDAGSTRTRAATTSIVAVGVEDEVRRLDGRRPRLAPPRRARPGHARRPGRTRGRRTSTTTAFNPYGRTWGASSRAAAAASRARRPTCFPLPTPDASGRRPVVRRPVAVRLRDRGPPLPAAVAVGQPVAVGRAEPERRRHRRADDADRTDRPTPDRADADRRSRTPEPTAGARPPEPTPEPTAAPPSRRRRPRRTPAPLPHRAPRRVASRPWSSSCRGVVVRRAGRTILGPARLGRSATGERWVVLGRNGSGKTTLLSVASMNLWPTAGTVEVLGERYGRTDARELRRRVGMAGSAVEAAMRPDLTPRDLIMTARHGAFEPWWHVYDDADRARAEARRAGLGLGDHLDQPFGTLSAGERRRTSIARALMPDPDVLLLDEPTASLDLAARETPAPRPGARWPPSERPTAIVLVSHHLEEIPPGFDHVLRAAPTARSPRPARSPTCCAPTSCRPAFGLDLAVDRRDGRWSARGRAERERPASTRERHRSTAPCDPMTTTTPALPASAPGASTARPARWRRSSGAVAAAVALGAVGAHRRPPAGRDLARRRRRPGRHRPPATRAPRTSSSPCSGPTTSSPSRSSSSSPRWPSGPASASSPDARSPLAAGGLRGLRRRRLRGRARRPAGQPGDGRGPGCAVGVGAGDPDAVLGLGRLDRDRTTAAATAPAADDRSAAPLVPASARGALGIAALGGRARGSLAHRPGRDRARPASAAPIPPADARSSPPLPPGADLAPTTPGPDARSSSPTTQFYRIDTALLTPVGRRRDVVAAHPRHGRPRGRP